MKERTGFVSNSSSSSFIIGMGFVKDLDALEEFIKSNNDGDGTIISVQEIVDGQHNNWSEKFKEDTGGSYSIKSFMYSSVGVTELRALLEREPDAKVYAYDGGRSLDESDFWDEDAEEYDHDITLDQFTRTEQAQYDIFSNKDIITDGEVDFGAGRDG